MEELQGIIHGLSTAVLLSLFAFSSFCSASSTHEAVGHKVPFMTVDFEDVLGRSFDYIIVGGGTSGCPLAATLSTRYSVLLVERGGSPYGNPLIEERKNHGFLLIQTNQFTSIAQAFISEEGVSNRRGRVLGGTTTINGGLYSRASEDYIQRVGWDAELVRESYEWVESKMVFRPNPPTPWQSVSAEGMVEAGVQPFNGFSLEHVKGTKVGGSIFDIHGRRHTAADLLAAGNSKRITVLLNATVQNVIFHDGGDGKKPRAHGIRFIRSDGNPNHFYEAYLSYPKGSRSWGDVILSAGTLGSPQILMLSGIGPQEHLKHFNISPLVDARGVGQAMQDNPSIAFRLNYSPNAFQNPQPDPPQVVGISDGFRIILISVILPTSPNTTRTRIVAKNANPVSRGSLRLWSTDPRQNPSVKFNYLAKERDLDECVEMAHLVEKVAHSRSIETFLGRRQSGIMNGSKYRDEELRDFCKKNVSTFYHYHGGCVVGSVVDKDYRVFGVKGLRVIDGSTLLKSPGTNPMATLLMLGRYQGIKMIRKRNYNSVSYPSESDDQYMTHPQPRSNSP
ncbi:(R)-mandelonitrile lyase-like isoform X2 [Magnolia sinica]|uniref:(R)-mandelonitrile lyase-like isoform X2 n=1 Tax=Magnolia sinica TaxID=86752 RepID=UPI002658EFA0|nr:(R)-mandelonitrile lyase-like isoform X2 [Magnolia sinica]